MSPTPHSNHHFKAIFVSDVHLQASLPATASAFLRFLAQDATKAKELYLLGDIFEYWAGDDDLTDPFLNNMIKAIRHVHDKGTAVFWIAGNRDFLVGPDFSQATGATLLPDPYILCYHHTRYVLTHGDALCTDDMVYQAFRKEVRDVNWQTAFLARPLSERKWIIDAGRKKSMAYQQTIYDRQQQQIMDVNSAAVHNALLASHAHIMIHGHTHRPDKHDHNGHYRYVLSDWDQDTANKKRGDWLTLDKDGTLNRVPFVPI